MTDEPREWVIPLPYTKPPLTQNSRMHWRARAAIVAALRGVGIVYTRQLKIPPLDRFTAELHYAPRYRRIIDGENLTPVAKSCVDGYCSVHKIPDDKDHYTQLPPVIEGPTGTTGRLWLVLREVHSDEREAARG